MRCPACDAPVPLAAGERIGFRATCEGCDADLHCCLACRHHDPGAANECREPSAEPVRDRERANRCEWFAAGEGGAAAGAGRDQARSALDALFKKR